MKIYYRKPQTMRTMRIKRIKTKQVIPQTAKRVNREEGITQTAKAMAGGECLRKVLIWKLKILREKNIFSFCKISSYAVSYRMRMRTVTRTKREKGIAQTEIAIKRKVLKRKLHKSISLREAAL